MLVQTLNSDQLEFLNVLLHGLVEGIEEELEGEKDDAKRADLNLQLLSAQELMALFKSATSVTISQVGPKPIVGMGKAS